MPARRDPMLHNPFEHAPFIGQLKEHQCLVVCDYDRTLTTGDRNPNEKELSDQRDVWRITAEAHAIDACISARSPGMMMSNKRYQDSVAHGYTEPQPRLYKNPATGKFEYCDPATMPFYQNAVDRKIIGSFGWGVLVQNGHGYRVDKAFEQLLQDKTAGASTPAERPLLDPRPVQEDDVPSASFRLAAAAFILIHCKEFEDYLAPLERHGAYNKGDMDVAPLPYRLQFDFAGTEGYRKMRELVSIVQRQKALGDPFARRIHLVDESRMQDDPEQSRWTLYWVPWYGRKENIFNWIARQASSAADCPVNKMQLFYAGDSPTDLKVALMAGGSAEVKSVIPSRSFLAPHLIRKSKRYGAIDLSFLWGSTDRVQPRLVPTPGRKGEYSFVHKLHKMIGHQSNVVVIADERYGDMTPPGSVATFLEEYLPQRTHKHAGH